MKYALVVNDVIVNIAEGQPDDRWVVLPANAGKGYSWDGTTWVAPTPIPEARNVSREDFVDRFTDEELAELTEILARGPGSQGRDPKWAVVRVAKERMDAKSEIDLASENLDAYLSRLVTFGVLTEQRKAEILS